MTPARVPDRIITEIRGRERDGLIELPKPPGLRRGDKVQIISGPFEDHLALYDGMAATSVWRSCCGFWAPSSVPSFPPLPWRRCR